MSIIYPITEGVRRTLTLRVRKKCKTIVCYCACVVDLQTWLVQLSGRLWMNGCRGMYEACRRQNYMFTLRARWSRSLCSS